MNIVDYKNQAREKWGDTEAYKEFEKRGKKNSSDNKLMDLFKHADSKTFPEELKNYITKNYYTCTDKILKSLAEMYLTPEFKNNIDAYAGIGSAKNAHDSIIMYLSQK